MAVRISEAVSKLESIIGYHCTRDPTLLWEALQASGSLNRVAGGREIIDGNKKLAALGDAVADHWLWLNLFRTKCSKGASSFQAAVLKETLAEQLVQGKETRNANSSSATRTSPISEGNSALRCF
jgi:hypothetical protein